MRSDLQNLGLILRVAKMHGPRHGPKAMAEEIRERLTEELDYECSRPRPIGPSRGPGAGTRSCDPEVATSLSSEHVLVTEYVEASASRR